MLTHRNILVEHRRGDAGVPADRSRRDDRRPAVLSRLRLHRHAVAAAGERRSASPTTRTRWTPRPSATSPPSTAARSSSARRRSTRRTSARLQPEQFAHLRYAVVGAEKLRPPIAAAFRERFGIDLIEGYGCTEMSPVVAVNMPESPARLGRPADSRRPARGSSIRSPARGRSSARKGCCWSADRTA